MLLGLVGGVPTIAGAWLGGFAYSPVWSVIFLALGVGAIAQVTAQILGQVAGDRPHPPISGIGTCDGGAGRGLCADVCNRDVAGVMAVQSRVWLAAGVTVVAVAMTIAAIGSMAKGRVREMSLVARDMAFYADGDSQRPIPSSAPAPGERLRITVTNNAPGMVHEIIDAVGAARPDRGPGCLDRIHCCQQAGRLPVPLPSARPDDEGRVDGFG